MNSAFGTLLLALVVAWLLQGLLSFWQARRFYGRIQQLRKLGRSAVGVSGSIYKTKAYAVLVADQRDRIVRAEKLTGFTILAQLKPVDLLVGRTLEDVISGPIEGLSPKLQSAFKMAAQAVLKGDKPTKTTGAGGEAQAGMTELPSDTRGEAPGEVR